MQKTNIIFKCPGFLLYLYTKKYIYDYLKDLDDLRALWHFSKVLNDIMAYDILARLLLRPNISVRAGGNICRYIGTGTSRYIGAGKSRNPYIGAGGPGGPYI